LNDPAKAAEIRAEFPAASIHRRNTGYAVDVLLETEVFTPDGAPFNFAKLICGSEGTLAFITEIKIHVDPLPPSRLGLLCAHFPSVADALKAVLIAMEYQPRAVELMDKVVMDCTKGNLMYSKNRFFIQGDPEAVLIIEVGAEKEEDIRPQLDTIAEAIQAEGLGYHFPLVFGADIPKVWNLRKAGLGLLANVPGDAKPVAVIEDTAVKLADLPAYIDEFGAMMAEYGQQAVYYAHAGAGELHLRPILDLKKSKDRKLFRDIGRSTAELVKKYDGSLSGEHGDGRVRAEFIPLMVGEANYQLLRRLKAAWDPKNIFNPGKIVDAPPMDASLRYEPEQETRQFDTLMDFSATDGILRAAEKCNGSGDCRKSHLSGGTMCPSFMATRQEKDTTRARANILREVLTRSNDENPFAHKDIYEVMDLCLACKGCASECPSNVNVATLKAEFLHQYYKKHGVPLRARAFAYIGKLNKLGAIAPGLTNMVLNGKVSSGLLKRILNVAPKRALPALQQTTLRRWWQKTGQHLPVATPQRGTVWLFCDEFTDFNDTHIGIKAVELLTRLGYQVQMTQHAESGRAPLSKGLLHLARRMAIYNVETFSSLVSEETPLLGIEPSAILGFRDEYPKLVPTEMQEQARKLGQQALTVEEFLSRELQAGRLDASQFSDQPSQVLLHGHCHQKALSSIQ
ncbi:MAG: FAD-linked oxidase C-terminal domain-containing protein, partial [Bacteroidota bacterium]